MLFPPLLKLGVIASYYKNKAYISGTLCINKDKPQKKCEGKCHLNKQLAKTQEKDSEKDVPLSSLKTELSPMILAEAMEFISPPEKKITCTDFSAISYSFNKSTDFFHPPQVLFYLS